MERWRMEDDDEQQQTVHSGGCHCGRVRWQAEAAPSVVACRCNCSICSMRGNVYFSVPSSRFKLAAGSKEFVATYSFGTHAAKHPFCRVCGIHSFYVPRTNPDRVSVAVSCIDRGTLRHVEIRHFDGINWERSYRQMAASSGGKQ